MPSKSTFTKEELKEKVEAAAKEGYVLGAKEAAQPLDIDPRSFMPEVPEGESGGSYTVTFRGKPRTWSKLGFGKCLAYVAGLIDSGQQPDGPVVRTPKD